MILNAHTDPYPRASKPRPARARPKRVREITAEAVPDELRVTEIKPDPHGSFEQKCAWMRARMAEKKRKKGTRR